MTPKPRTRSTHTPIPVVRAFTRGLRQLTCCGLMVMLTALVTPAMAEFNVSRGSDLMRAGTEVSTPAAEWHYTVRPGETLQQISDELVNSNIGLQRLAGYNNLGVRSVLTAGDTLRIPVAWLQQQPQPATLTAVSGQVQLRTASTGRIRRASDGDLIRAGDTIITRDGTATVELADGSRIRVNPASEILFNRLTRYNREGMTDTRMRLERGGVSNRVRPTIEGGARFEVETPSAIAAVRGTVFSLQADHDGSRVQVTEGEVTFGQPGHTRTIPAGFSASLAPGSSHLQITRLPPAPEATPLPGTVAGFPLELSWQPTGTGLYQVQVLNSDTGAQVLDQQTRDTRFSLDSLRNGRYTVEIAALTPAGLTGLPHVAGFQVDLAARAAYLQSPDNSAALDDDDPLFQWQFQGENEQARVEIARNQNFEPLLAYSQWTPEDSARLTSTLAPGQYYWRVMTEAGETSTAASEIRSLVINGMLPPVRVLSTNYIDRQVRIFWETINEANGYRLQLSEDPSFREILKEANVNDTTAALRLIPGRRYFVRLKAVSDGPLAGRWGPGRELFIE